MGFFDFFKNLGGGKKPSLPAAPKPASSARVIYLRKEHMTVRSEKDFRNVFGDDVRISGRTVDLLGAVLDGSKLPKPKDSQDEGAASLGINLASFKLSNGWVRKIPGGIAVREPQCVFTGLRFIDIGEDALSTTTERATEIIVDMCEFWNDANGDKSLQLNQANKALVSRSKFVGGITGMRLQKKSYETEKPKCEVEDTEFVGVDTAINASGGVRVLTRRLRYKDVRLKFKAGDGAKNVPS